MIVVVTRNARRYFPSSFTMALVVAVFLGIPSVGAVEDNADYEFANVENLPLQKGLPDPFLMSDGKHAQNQEDWAALLDFADNHLFDKTTDRRFDNWNYPDAELPFDWKAPDVVPPVWESGARYPLSRVQAY